MEINGKGEVKEKKMKKREKIKRKRKKYHVTVYLSILQKNWKNWKYLSPKFFYPPYLITLGWLIVFRTKGVD